MKFHAFVYVSGFLKRLGRWREFTRQIRKVEKFIPCFLELFSFSDMELSHSETLLCLLSGPPPITRTAKTSHF